MTNENVAPPSQLQHRSAVVRTLGTMPGWKRKLLAVSLVIGLAGLAGQTVATLTRQSAPAQPAAPAARATDAQRSLPAGSSEFVYPQPGSISSTPQAPPAAPPPAAQPTLTERVTPWMTRVGLSFFVGIVVGVVFRTFVKLAAGFAVIVTIIFLALSYFQVLNVDMTRVKGEYASARAWMGDQASRLKGVIFQALPSSTAAAAGFLSGMKKR